MNRKMRATCGNAHDFINNVSGIMGLLLKPLADETNKKYAEKELQRLSAMDLIDRKRAL